MMMQEKESLDDFYQLRSPASCCLLYLGFYSRTFEILTQFRRCASYQLLVWSCPQKHLAGGTFALNFLFQHNQFELRLSNLLDPY